MLFKNITLLTDEEYIKYKSLIPVTDDWWWLKTPYSAYKNGVRAIKCYGDRCNNFCFSDNGGVRPLCVFEVETADSIFWSKPEMLIGSKIEYGKYKWTVLNVESSVLYVLCDEIITRRRFDSSVNVWANSELRRWLKTEGLKIMNI